MAGRNIVFYCSDYNYWIIREALKKCKQTNFTYKNKELNSDTEIIKLGLEMVRQYFNLNHPISYRDLKKLDDFLHD